MHAGRGNRVEPGQNTARQYRQREGLIAGAVVIAAGHLVSLVKRMIDLPDKAVDIVACRRSDEEVRGRIKQRDRAVRRRPRLSREKFRDDRIRCAAQRGDLARIGHSRYRVQTYPLALAFVAREPKRFVFYYRPAERHSELIVAERGLRIGLWVEEVSRIKPVVAEELEQRAVEVVGSRLGDDVDDRAGVAAVFGFEVRLYGSLRDGFDWENSRGCPEHAGFVDRGQISITVIHIGAVEQIVVRAPAIAVRAEQSERTRGIGRAGRISGCARNQHQELRVVTSVDWKIHDLTRGNSSPQRVGCRLDLHGVRLNLDAF